MTREQHIEGAKCPHCGHYCHGKSVFCTPPMTPDRNVVHKPPPCCEKCESVIPTDSPDGSLLQNTYCNNATCECHTVKADRNVVEEKVKEFETLAPEYSQCSFCDGIGGFPEMANYGGEVVCTECHGERFVPKEPLSDVQKRWLRTALTEVADHTRAAERAKLRGVVEGMYELQKSEMKYWDAQVASGDTGSVEQRAVEEGKLFALSDVLKALTPPEATAE